MATFFAGLNGAAQGAGGWGNLIKGAGSALNFGSALGTVFGGKGKQSDKAAEYAEAAAMQNARQEIVNGEIKARQDLMNAYAANRDAAHTKAMSEEEAFRIEREGRKQRGAQLAAMASGGAAISTPELDMVAEDMMQIEMAVTRTLYNGHLESRALRDQSADFLASGEAARKTATQRAKAQLAEGHAKAFQIRQERKKEVMGGLGGLVKGAAGIFGMFQGMSGGSGGGSSPLSALSGIFGGGNAEVSGMPWLTSSQGGGENYTMDF